MSTGTPQSSSDAVDKQNPLLVAHGNDGGVRDRPALAGADDPVLKAVFDRIRRDLTFISRHHPHLKMSGEELSVWAKAIARQLTAETSIKHDKGDVMH
jgi:hypothetical protein